MSDPALCEPKNLSEFVMAAKEELDRDNNLKYPNGIRLAGCDCGHPLVYYLSHVGFEDCPWCNSLASHSGRIAGENLPELV